MARRTVDVVEAAPKLKPAAEDAKVLYFFERTGDYAYDYELKVGLLGYTVLSNRRINLTTGQISVQNGYCMTGAD